MSNEIPVTLLPHDTAESLEEFYYIFKRTYAREFGYKEENLEINKKPSSNDKLVDPICDIEVRYENDINLFYLLKKEIYYPNIDDIR